MKRMQNYPLLGIALVIGLIFIVMPLTLDLFRLNLIGKYLTYAFVAVGLVLCWGYSGILSLGQGIFFGLGGYCMAMFLKLESFLASGNKNANHPGHPGFYGLESANRFALVLAAIPFF